MKWCRWAFRSLLAFVGVTAIICWMEYHARSINEQRQLLSSLQELECLLVPKNTEISFIQPLQISIHPLVHWEPIPTVIAMQCAAQISGEALTKFSKVQSNAYTLSDDSATGGMNVSIPDVNRNFATDEQLVWNIGPLSEEAFQRALQVVKKNRGAFRLVCHRQNLEAIGVDSVQGTSFREIIVCSEDEHISIRSTRKEVGTNPATPPKNE